MPARQLHILQICHDYEGPFRGVCHQYAEAFADHHVTTLFLCGEQRQEVEAAVGGDEVIFLEQSRADMRGIKFTTLFRIAGLFRRQRFDVVVAHRYKAIYIAGIMSYFFPISILLAVAHEHGVYRRRTRSLFINFWRRNITCIGVSESVSRDIERYCGPLAARGRLYTLPHALDVDAAGGLVGRVEARQALGLDTEAFCFGTIGRLVDKKDHETLLSGFGKFCTRHPEAKILLVMVGGGPEETRLRRLADELGIAERVRFAGHVHGAARYLKALDVFVLSSGIQEAFGMVLLEAMLARLPLISSDAPGPREVVGEAAHLFNTGNVDSLANQLEALYKMSAAERAQLGQKGRDRLEAEFSQAAFNRRLWSIPDIAATGGKTE